MALNFDLVSGLLGQARAADKVAKQRAWIAYCEANGQSYAGPRGREIREADESALRAYENELAHFEGKHRR